MGAAGVEGRAGLLGARLTAHGALLSEGTAAEAGGAASGPVEDRSRGEFGMEMGFSWFSLVNWVTDPLPVPFRYRPFVPHIPFDFYVVSEIIWWDV